jgi:hypothetical protein
METIRRGDGSEWVVYHVSEAGAPAVHDTSTGEWFYEPKDNRETGSVYSLGYPSVEAATDAIGYEDEENYDELVGR